MKLRTVLLGAALLAACALRWYWEPLGPWLHTRLRLLMHHDLSLPYPPPPPAEKWQAMPAAERLADVRARLLPALHDELAKNGLKLGQPAFIRIFKESRELELWMQDASGRWKLFRAYPVACFSGMLGPKTREGDMQAPEGCYGVTLQQLNPASSYHLSFNIGYPNAYDRHHQRTGSLIMVHGDVCSIGCFAMTDPLIEEIYLVVEAALHSGGDMVPVHVFPFRMTDARWQQAQKDEPAQLAFWQELLPVYAAFETHGEPPGVVAQAGRYRLFR